MSDYQKMFVAGEWRESDKSEKVINPYNGETICEIAVAQDKDAEDATAAAVEVFKTMKKMPGYERSEILMNIVKEIENRRKELVEIMAVDAGRPVRIAEVELDRSLHTFTTGAEEAKRIGGEVIPMDVVKAGVGYYAMTKRFPVGPILGITPFNFPLNLLAHKLAPAIAAGCTLVVKAPPQAPLTAHILGEITESAGLPKGAFSVFHCDVSTAEKLVTDERYRMISFTGSSKVGWHIRSIAGTKKVLLELGNNSAAIVHNDTASLQHAADRCALGGYGAAGQSCVSVQRIYVQEKVLDEFKELFFKSIANLKVGDPLDPDVSVGPVIDETSADRIEAWIKEATEGNATILTGGKRHGLMIEPTLLIDTTPEMNVNAGEIFGPAVTLTPYSDFKDAVKRANNTKFGLQAGIFTQDISNILYAFENFDMGGVVVNDYPTFRIDHMPYGGSKDSGLGREGIKYAIDEMTEIKLLIINNSAN